MFKSTKICFTSFIFIFANLFASLSLYAQDAEVAAPAKTNMFMDIVFGGSPVDILIWMMIFATSGLTVWFIIDGLVNIKRDKFLPDDLVDGIRDTLDEGDLDGAIQTCELNPGSLSKILMAGFNNINEGFEVIQDAITAAADLETEKVMQRVNYLNMCGQIAPMLGLMGTVTGMVSAFAGLATASGAAKAAVLAKSISGALWTTCVGLLISVPALVGFTLIKNYAAILILETEAVVIDLVKILRVAEVDEEEEEEEE